MLVRDRVDHASMIGVISGVDPATNTRRKPNGHSVRAGNGGADSDLNRGPAVYEVDRSSLAARAWARERRPFS
jgi:hypothetical protein